MNGKIARLPQAIREQLNRRLADHEPHRRILPWLNSLPEVQAVLAADFAGQPVSKQNLSEWTQYGYRHWKIRHDALAFAANDDSTPPPSTAVLTDKLVQWLACRFAALTRKFFEKLLVIFSS